MARPNLEGKGASVADAEVKNLRDAAAKLGAK